MIQWEFEEMACNLEGFALGDDSTIEYKVELRQSLWIGLLILSLEWVNMDWFGERAEGGMDEVEWVSTYNEDEGAEIEDDVEENIPRKDVMEFLGSSDDDWFLVATSWAVLFEFDVVDIAWD